MSLMICQWTRCAPVIQIVLRPMVDLWPLLITECVRSVRWKEVCSLLIPPDFLNPYYHPCGNRQSHRMTNYASSCTHLDQGSYATPRLYSCSALFAILSVVLIVQYPVSFSSPTSYATLPFSHYLSLLPVQSPTGGLVLSPCQEYCSSGFPEGSE